MINAWKLIKLLRPKMQSFGLHPNMGVSLLYGLALENFLGQKKHKKKKEELLVSKRNSNGLLADLLEMAS